MTIQAHILDLMRRIHRHHGTAIILGTHDLGVAAEFGTTIAVMYAGQVVERGTTDQVIGEPRHPYTQELLACRPGLAERKAIVPIPDEVPDLVSLPVGCALQPRCAYARPECAGEPILMSTVGSGHYVRCIMAGGYEPRPVDAARLGLNA